MSETFDFGDGNGPVPAHRHQNPDGSTGGWVAETVDMDVLAYVGPDALVYGSAKVIGDAKVRGTSRISGGVLTRQAVVEKTEDARFGADWSAFTKEAGVQVWVFEQVPGLGRMPYHFHMPSWSELPKVLYVNRLLSTLEYLAMAMEP